jgi:N-acetylglutamate synthase-like GNAT family acetyltransferase
MEIEYKTPDLKDLQEIIGLMPALYREIGAGFTDVLKEFLRDEQYFKIMAVEKGGGKVIGFMVGCCRLEMDFECRAGIIEEIVIHPDHRKLGIGGNMLGIFYKWCAAKGAKGVLVPCGREGFYEKMGFEKHTITRYWKDLPW